SSIGGFYLSNLMSASVSLAALAFLYRLLVNRFSSLTAVLVILGIGTNPYWIIASSSSIDYVYGVFFFVLALYLWINGKSVSASAAFALAASSRITYVPLIGIVYFSSFLLAKYNKKTLIKAITGFIIMSCLLYFPVFYSSGMSFSFLDFSSGQWSFLQYASRFVYKNIYLWGLPAFLFLITVICIDISRIKTRFTQYTLVEKTISYSVAVAFVLTEALFARLPHEIAYLFPVMFIVVCFLAVLKRSYLYLTMLILLHLMYGVVNFDVLNIQYKQGVNPLDFKEAAAAETGFFVRRGVVIEDLANRKTAQEFYLKKYLINNKQGGNNHD
ncbi:MAG TPA: hypothetical protein VJL89_12420, partial [Thermodesulfovibrionia bacterium]|nr:hypothetical protein [Thermodesulfovibrionia bacterium]